MWNAYAEWNLNWLASFGDSGWGIMIPVTFLALSMLPGVWVIAGKQNDSWRKRYDPDGPRRKIILPYWLSGLISFPLFLGGIFGMSLLMGVIYPVDQEYRQRVNEFSAAYHDRRDQFIAEQDAARKSFDADIESLRTKYGVQTEARNLPTREQLERGDGSR